MRKSEGALPRAELVQEMHQAKIRFIPTLELYEDSIIEEIYEAWAESGKVERANLYWKDRGKDVEIRRRRKKI